MIKLNASTNGLRLLVVDDEPMVRTSMQLLLESKGYAVATADSAAETFALCKTTDFAAVILDYEMPGMKGDAMARALKQLFPQLPVVMVTAYADDIRIREDSFVDAILPKPFDIKKLINTLARLCQSNMRPAES